ncbi:MAG: hypothetical protein BWK76_10775 [Desulfobulbaceae bacterium A2]|nr:MAG: hypothetical protein BWK76_10775 [Desulfobulbaceae bacterium A2]
MLALLLIALLTTLTLRLIGIVRVERHDSGAYAAHTRLDAVLHAGLHLATTVLRVDRRLGPADTLTDPWARLSGQDLHALLEYGEARLEIGDLSGRLQVNALVAQDTRATNRARRERLQREAWLRLLVSGRFGPLSEDEALALIEALADWIDTDDSPRPGGAESSWYQGQGGGYACRNGPVTSLEELLLIRGMTRGLLFGDSAHPGLADFITVTGQDGRVNINTAPPEVLLALGASNGQTADMVAFRAREANRKQIEQPDWPRRQLNISLPPEMLTTASDSFFLRIEAVDGIFRRYGEAVLQREKSGQCRVLSWYLR